MAGVGDTEEELKQRGRPYKLGTFPYKPLGRARAADMIAEAVVALEYRASAEDIARMPHAHPTFSEAFREACLTATENRSLHS